MASGGTCQRRADTPADDEEDEAAAAAAELDAAADALTKPAIGSTSITPRTVRRVSASEFRTVDKLSVRALRGHIGMHQ